MDSTRNHIATSTIELTGKVILLVFQAVSQEPDDQSLRKFTLR